jgi:hypothetical protein
VIGGILIHVQLIRMLIRRGVFSIQGNNKMCVYGKFEETGEEVVADHFKAESRYMLLRLVVTLRCTVRKSEGINLI